MSTLSKVTISDDIRSDTIRILAGAVSFAWWSTLVHTLWVWRIEIVDMVWDRVR